MATTPTDSTTMASSESPRLSMSPLEYIIGRFRDEKCALVPKDMDEKRSREDYDECIKTYAGLVNSIKAYNNKLGVAKELGYGILLFYSKQTIETSLCKMFPLSVDSDGWLVGYDIATGTIRGWIIPDGDEL